MNKIYILTTNTNKKGEASLLKKRQKEKYTSGIHTEKGDNENNTLLVLNLS